MFVRTFRFCQGVRRAHVADRKRGHKRHEQERGGDSSKRRERVASSKEAKTTQRRRRIGGDWLVRKEAAKIGKQGFDTIVAARRIIRRGH